jgi:hypothetical protein
MSLRNRGKSRSTYKVYADGADVALCVCVILLQGKSVQNHTRVESCKSIKKQLTANRRSKQDLPTPESPISKSCKQTATL